LGLADEISASQESLYRRSRSAVCSVKFILDYLSPEDRKALQALLDDKRVFGTSIAELLNGWAPKVEIAAEDEKDSARSAELIHLAQLCGSISDGTVQRHRRGKCLCAEDA